MNVKKKLLFKMKDGLCFCYLFISYSVFRFYDNRGSKSGLTAPCPLNEKSRKRSNYDYFQSCPFYVPVLLLTVSNLTYYMNQVPGNCYLYT